MGVGNCISFVQGGGRTQFDMLLGLIESVEEELSRAAMSWEFHPGDGPIPEGWSEATEMEATEGLVPHVIPHLVDRKADLLETLTEAKAKVEEIWYAILEAKEAVP